MKKITYIYKLIKSFLEKMISIIKSPNQLEPAFQNNMLYVVDSDNKNDNNFRYGFELYFRRKTSSETEWEKINKTYGYPLEQGYGIYTPHRILQDYLSYDNNFNIMNPVVSLNSALFYKINFIENYKPNLSFIDIIHITSEIYHSDWENDGFDIWTADNVEINNSSGTYVVNKINNSTNLGQITATFNLVTGELYDIEIKYGLEAFVDGEISLFINNEELHKSDLHIGSQTVKCQFISTGEDVANIQIKTPDNNDNNFIEYIKITKDGKAIEFENVEDNILEPNDIITIDMYNKMINSHYSNDFKVESITTKYAIINANGLEYSFTQPGEIKNISRLVGFSEEKIAFNGKRCYEDLNKSFEDIYMLDAYEGSYKRFKYLTVYDKPKTIRLNEYETLSFIQNPYLEQIPNESLLRINYIFYDSNDEVLLNYREYLLDFGLNKYPRLDIPSGTKNVSDMSLDVENIIDDVAYYYVNIIVDEAEDTNVYLSKKYIIDRTCTFNENIRLVWLNELGAMEYLTLSEKNRYMIEAERKTIDRNLSYDYSIGDFERDIISSKYREVIELNSPLLNEDEVVLFESLFKSPKIWMIKNINNEDVLIPYVNIDTNFTILDYTDDKISYVIRLEKSVEEGINI